MESDSTEAIKTLPTAGINADDDDDGVVENAQTTEVNEAAKVKQQKQQHQQQSESVEQKEESTTTNPSTTTTSTTSSSSKQNPLTTTSDTDEEEEIPPTKRLKCNTPEADQQAPESTQQVQSTQSNLRSFKRIPVFIVDYHNDVLEFIYRCLATRHLPLEKNILVHFDSHPDMVIARDIPASAAYDKDTMLTELSIENWIMPMLYAGHFDRVVWLKNSWCQQLPTGKHKFSVGHKDDRIGVDCALDYFIADGNYCPTEELQEKRNVELQVYDADTERLDPTEFLNAAKDQHSFVLDIDLDFFSTSNPFLEIYKDADCYAQLTEIFQFVAVEKCKTKEANYIATAARRKQQLEALRHIFWHLESKRSFTGLEPPDTTIISAEIYEKVVRLANELQRKYADDEIDWLLIFDSGSTTDNNGLPHHISTSAELEQYFAYFKLFLQRLPVPPVAITMAHSAQDDYCPQNQVAFIEQQVLKLLREVFGDRVHEPILHYMDDEWDVMKL